MKRVGTYRSALGNGMQRTADRGTDLTELNYARYARHACEIEEFDKYFLN